jgi:16S rRNA (cytosine967-C5)-methyltransferase
MDELGVKELGEKVWATEITQPAKVVLRVNT